MTSNQPKYPSTFPNRRSIRLKGYDYSNAGMYFITICCQDMQLRFGKIENCEMQLNDFGKIAHDEWTNLSERFPNVILDAFQIMPNHIHFIIALENVRAGLAPAPIHTNSTTVGAGLAPAQTKCQNDANRTGASPVPTNRQNGDNGAGASPARAQRSVTSLAHSNH